MSELKVGDYTDNIYFVRKPYDIDDIIGAGMNFDPEEDDYRGERVRVDKVITLEDKTFDKFSSNFFARNAKELEYIGGRDCIEGYTHCVLVRNKQNGMELFVNTEGHDYARYVGVKNDIVIDDENVILIKRDSQ